LVGQPFGRYLLGAEPSGPGLCPARWSRSRLCGVPRDEPVAARRKPRDYDAEQGYRILAEVKTRLAIVVDDDKGEA
jgi:hypothetical protein